jgi:hypothetical protein
MCGHRGGLASRRDRAPRLYERGKKGGVEDARN